MIGWKNGANASFADPAPLTTITTGISSDVTNRGTASVTHMTTTKPSRARTGATSTGGRRDALNVPVSSS